MLTSPRRRATPSLPFPILRRHRQYEEADEFCPRCDNHYVIPAKTPQMGIGLQGDEKLVLVGDSVAPTSVSLSIC